MSIFVFFVVCVNSVHLSRVKIKHLLTYLLTYLSWKESCNKVETVPSYAPASFCKQSPRGKSRAMKGDLRPPMPPDIYLYAMP